MLPYEQYTQHKEAISTRLSKWRSASFFPLIDAYVIPQYPKTHQYFAIFQADLAYWYSMFGKSKKRAQNTSFPKGIVQLKIDESWTF